MTISKLAAWVREIVKAADGATARPDGASLILAVEVYVEARCACGSPHIHRLSLTATSECRRCSRTLGVRSLEYYRPSVNTVPNPVVSVGYVLTTEALARRPTSGVH
jgi:hypothetical protein